jgi:23S rRNA (adenine2503-C2)-methyltransferase
MFKKFLESIGEKKFRIDQVNHAIFRDLVSSFDEITTISESLREKLKREESFSSLSVVKHLSFKDTEKILFKTEDNKLIESVLIKHENRKTVCISSQIGCPAGCIFCATGKMGITRNLSSREIYEQVLYWNRYLKKKFLENNSNEKWNGKNPPYDGRVRNIVFMGMGEPLFNYENVIDSIKFLNDDKKFAIGVRHITISTVGIIPGIEKLLKENLTVNLAFSLHAATDDLRTSLVPMNKTYNLDSLMKIFDKYTKITKRRIFYEYVVLKNINDQERHAHDLGNLLSRRMAHINFIPYNVNPECGEELKKPEEKSIRIMQKILLDKYDVPSTIRMTMGDEMDAACGQLANKS